jgi:TPR repeat protein
MKLPIRTISRLALALSVALACGTAAAAEPKEQTARAEAAFRSGDLVTAMSLLKAASDAGHPPAQARLADLLVAAEQYTEAAELYHKAADQGEPGGIYGLGRMSADGLGVARDPAKALALYRTAAEKNHWPAIDALARAYRSGDLGLAKDLAEADRMDRRAKELREVASKAAGR